MHTSSPHEDALLTSAKRLKRWCTEKALPLWVERAQLPDGSWVEHLHLDGQPDKQAERRWRVLARQVYVYAKAAKARWYDGHAIAKSTYRRMQEIGYVHRVSMDGIVQNDMRDLYDHAFYILAASSLYDLTKDETYLRDAEALLHWVDENLAHPQGGWMDTNRVNQTDARRQNPHMHLLEASLFLHGVTGEEKHLRYARDVFALFKKHIFDHTPSGHGSISEFFEADWTLTKGAYGQTAEPGHGMEWVWLLGQYERATGTHVRSYQQALYTRAQAKRSWFLNDEEDKSGDIRRETKRLWVQTEVIKAHLAMAEARTHGARDMAAATIDALFPTYLTPEGLWNDQINACDTNIAKTIPVSTFYHILCMAVEAERISKTPS